MTGDAAHRVGIFIMDLAADDSMSPFTAFCGGILSCPNDIAGLKKGGCHAKGTKDHFIRNRRQGSRR